MHIHIPLKVSLNNAFFENLILCFRLCNNLYNKGKYIMGVFNWIIKEISNKTHWKQYFLNDYFLWGYGSEFDFSCSDEYLKTICLYTQLHRIKNRSDSINKKQQHNNTLKNKHKSQTKNNAYRITFFRQLSRQKTTKNHMYKQVETKVT